jgi:hypothetical protein
MKVAHRYISHVENYLRLYVKNTHLPPLSYEVIIVNLNTHTPEWVRMNQKCDESISDDNMYFPRLHQDYSFDGIHPGPSSLAGTLMASIINKHFASLPYPSLYVPMYKLLHYYGYNKDTKPITDITMTNYAPKTTQRYEQRKRRAINSAPYKIQRLQDRIADLSKTVKSGLVGITPNLQHRRKTYFNETVTVKPTIDHDFYYNASLSDKLKSTNITTPYLEVNYDDLVQNTQIIKIALLGHSFVNHVEPDMTVIDNSKFDIQCFGISGGKISEPTKRAKKFVTFNNNFRTVRWRQYRPHLTFLLIGGNDISFGKSVSSLTAQFDKLRNSIDWPGSIVVMSIEPRFSVRNSLVSMQVYEEKRVELNNRLSNVFREQFWDLEQFWANISSRQNDGIHLNELHNKLLSNYIKGKVTQIVGFECE